MGIRGVLCLGLLVAVSSADACGRNRRRCEGYSCYPTDDSDRRPTWIGDRLGGPGRPRDDIYGLKKRSAELPGEIFHHRFETSPCHIVFYDRDKDGVIRYDELHSMFADVELAKRFFNDLDTSGDEVITLDEFYHAVPKIIYECGLPEPTENNTDAAGQKEEEDKEDVEEKE